jgi:hypothetical protein
VVQPEGDVHATRVQPLDTSNCGLHLTRGRWALDDQRQQSSSSMVVKGEMVFQNTTKRNEIFVTDVKPRTRLLSKGDVTGIEVRLGLAGSPSLTHLDRLHDRH